MNIFRNNVVYVVLALLAIVLIGITVGLQIVILSSPPTSQESASDTQPGNTTAAVNQDGAAVLAPAPTNTPVMIVIQPTALPPTPIQENTTSTEPEAAAPVEDAPEANAPTAVAPASQPVEEAPNPVRAMLGAENVTSSQDDNIRISVLSGDPFAIGFFGYAYYVQNNAATRAVSIQLDGGRVVEPNRENALGGAYPLARPLYLYSTAADIQQKPQVEAFLGCYLNRVNTEILQTGYFPADQLLFTASLQNYDNSCALCRKEGVLPACTLDGIPAAPIDISGSSTIYPVTQRIADLFTTIGFIGDIQIDPIGTGAGFERFCEEGLSDIVNADRSINDNELAACRAINREPIAFTIGADALTLVVSKENTFVNGVTLTELQAIFSTAKSWSDVRPEWPNELIKRVIPGEQSGSLDFFANRIYTSIATQAFASAANILALTPAVDTPTAPTPQQSEQEVDTENVAEAPTQTPSPIPPAPSPTQAPVEPTSTPEALEPAPTPTFPPPTVSIDSADGSTPQFDYLLAWAPERPECLVATQIVQKVIEQNFQVSVVAKQYNNLDDMYNHFKARDGEALQHISLCYLDPLDRKYLPEVSSWMAFLGSGYWNSDSQKWLVVVHSHLVNNLSTREPCLLQLFKKLDFGEGPLNPPDVDGWLAAHPDRVEAWLQCE